MRILLALGVIGLMVGCDRASEESSARSVATPAMGAEQLVEVTNSWYSVNPELSMLCAGPTKEQIAPTRKEHGPHGAEMIQVSMNPRAKAALEAGKTYPVGSIVEKRKSGGAVGKMVKREPGFAELYGDWEFFYREAKGKDQKCRTRHAPTATRRPDPPTTCSRPGARASQPSRSRRLARTGAGMEVANLPLQRIFPAERCIEGRASWLQ